ncbi:MAG: hypothetical protein PVF75_02510 [Granulosicoccaceae bacterium]|jgi:hypothetical protein
MRALLGIIIVIDVYVIVYYRLLARVDYEKIKGIKENVFGVIFSFPPYSSLSVKGKMYAKRYWYALMLLLVCFALLAATTTISINPTMK